MAANTTVGIGVRLTSRLIPTDMFQTEEGIVALSNGILQAATATGIEGAFLPIQSEPNFYIIRTPELLNSLPG